MSVTLDFSAPYAAKPEVQLRIMAAANRMVGTPFKHQGQTPGVALDCVGLLRAVGIAAFEIDIEEFPPYPRETDGKLLFETLGRYCRPVSSSRVRVADVLVFRRGRAQWHTGLLAHTDPPTMIHAWSRWTGGSVRHDQITLDWRRKFHSAWRYKV